MYEFRMPSLGADMEAGRLTRWLVKPGDRVKRGDIVAIIETEKSDIEVEIFASGEVERLLVERGEKVPVGTLMATLRTDGEEAARPETSPPVPLSHRPPTGRERGDEIRTGVAPPGGLLVMEGEKPSLLPAPAEVGATIQATSPLSREEGGRWERGTGGEGLRASPAARRRARELDLDLAAVSGTGPGGAVTLADVELAAHPTPVPAAPPPPPHRPHVHPVARNMAEALGVDLSQVTGTGIGGAVTKADVEAAAAPRDRAASMRRAIGAAMARSKREIPHYYLSATIDMRRALAWLEEENRRRPVEERLLPAVLLLKAVALALRKVPELNGLWVDGAFRPSEAVHVGVAVSIRGGGLIAPAIHDADKRSLGELMAALRDLVQRARAGTLRSSEMTDPTITVTNLGDQGVETVFGVIYPPQVALVGLGRIVERPWAEGGMLGVRPVLTATLSADHRASDGHRGALFLTALDQLLQKPETL